MGVETRFLLSGSVVYAVGHILDSLGQAFKMQYLLNNQQKFDSQYTFTDKNGDGIYFGPEEIVPKVENPLTVIDFADLSKNEWGDPEWGVLFDEYVGPGVSIAGVVLLVLGLIGHANRVVPAFIASQTVQNAMSIVRNETRN